MKIQAAILLTSFACYAQYQPGSEMGFHKHDGFYLSMSGGPSFGSINLDATGAGYSQLTFSGVGGFGDFKIGGAIKENLILSADLIAHVITGPEVAVDGKKTGNASDKVSAGGSMLGVGLCYYFMPINIFLDGTLGFGHFTLRDDSNNINSSSENGFAMALKAGKEWWVSRNWGLGVSAGFFYQNAKDKSDPSTPTYSGKLSTSKLAIMFNTTYN